MYRIARQGHRPRSVPNTPITRIDGKQRVLARSVTGLLLLAGLSACSDITGVAPTSNSRLVDPESVLQAVSATGTTYYVSPGGSDRNTGTSIARAWKTISRVNGKVFGAGDRILFQGGSVFAGALSFNAADKGSAAGPIVVSSYGSGRATINGGSGTAIALYNTSGFEIRNLTLVGSGRTTNTGSGLKVYADLAGGVQLPYIRVDSVEASGFGKFGIVVGSWNNTTGFSDVRITYSSAHDNGQAGVSTYAQALYAHRNFYFGHLLSYNNSGVAGLTVNSGSGIVMGSVTGGVIERSVAHDNGWLCDAPEGPVGIWTYDSDGVVIQHNESYRNRTNGPADGGGFDLDQNTRNSVVQYNYSHDNDGAGFLLAHAPDNTNHSGNTVRYNVSENDARKNSAAAIVVWGRTIGAEIYNNSVYLTPSTTGALVALKVHNASIPTHDVKNVHIRNNTFYTTGGLKVLSVSAGQLSGAIDLRFEGNNYFAGSTAPTLLWGSTTYTGLATWRSATTQEMLSGVAVGSQIDPAFVSPGGGGTIGNADQLGNLTAYKLKATSPMVNTGLDLRQKFGTNVGPIDYYVGSIAFGAGFDVGAHEWR